MKLSVPCGVGLLFAISLDASACASSSAGLGAIEASPTEPEPSASAATRPVRSDRPNVLWVGDRSMDLLMIPWKTCSESPCRASLDAVKGAGRDGGTGVKFHGEGKGITSAGWLFERRGAFTLDDALTMWLRVEAQSVADAPPIDGTWVSIYRGSIQVSRRVLIDDCIANFTDGEAHRVVIPIAALYQPGDGFEPQVAEGISFMVMSSTSRNFNLYVDDIKLEALDANTSKALCQPSL